MSEIAGVTASISYDKGFFKEKWSFYTPIATPVIAGKPAGQESKQTESIPDQIIRLEELKNAGIITLEEYDKKKQELLDRM
ncbi:MAG: SHOCT domain-containing protein [Chloroflexi bacterium]|nr:SHOCT domain-containing protein [Chloroflexota bacterium]MBT7080063.1 SHOCT domain-containing protein [Chloroflexota bacterium]MBT7289774.1 SHOCT domain-containing protein [Chloroflexota bacterium]